MRESIEQASAQPALDHRDVRHDRHALRQGPNPGRNRSRRNKDFVNDIEVSTRVDQTLQDIPLRLRDCRPIAAGIDNPKTFRFNRMRQITVLRNL